MFCAERGHMLKTTTFFFFSWTSGFDTVLQTVLLVKWTRWNKRDKVQREFIFLSFRVVSEQRKTEEWDFRFWQCEKWNESQEMKEGGREGKDHFSRVLWLSFLVLCSKTAWKRLLGRLSLTPCSICGFRETSSSASTVVVDTGLSAYLQSHPSAARRSSSHARWQGTISSVSIPFPRPTSVTEKPRPHYFKFQLLPGKFLKIKFDRLALLALMDR